jgi:hypothetical protein
MPKRHSKTSDARITDNHSVMGVFTAWLVLQLHEIGVIIHRTLVFFTKHRFHLTRYDMLPRFLPMPHLLKWLHKYYMQYLWIIKEYKILPFLMGDGSNFPLPTEYNPMTEDHERDLHTLLRGEAGAEYCKKDGKSDEYVFDSRSYYPEGLDLRLEHDLKHVVVRFNRKEILSILLCETNELLMKNRTPNPWSWKYALCTSIAAVEMVEQLFLHLLDVHLIGEVVAISLFKNLPRKHPVYRLLEPVCTLVPFINEAWGYNEIKYHLAQILPITPEGLDQLVEARFTAVNRKSHAFVWDIYDLAENICDPAARKRCLSVRDRIQEFVETNLRRYYGSDEQFAEDPDVINFMRDVNSFVPINGGPKSWEDDSLLKWVGAVLYNCTYRHEQHHKDQYDNPEMNMQWATTYMKDVKHVPVTEEEFRASLPAMPDVHRAARIAFALERSYIQSGFPQYYEGVKEVDQNSIHDLADHLQKILGTNTIGSLSH